MKILITGGNGQIGSHLIELLLRENCKILNIDNLKTGRKVHLKTNKNLENYFFSISHSKKVEEVFNKFKPEVVVHCAASYKDPDDWDSDIMTNCVGTVNLLKNSQKTNVKKFIYFQTALCYGLKPSENPISLAHNRVAGGSSYAISKTCAEQYIENSGIPFVTFRLANVIGPRNLSGPLPIFFSRLKKKQKCFVTKSKRDFVFVKDLVNVVKKAVNGKGNGAYHFSSGKDVEILQLYNSVVKALKINDYPSPDVLKIHEDDVGSILLDPSKTQKDFGKISYTPLDVIVEEAVDYYERFGIMGQGFTHLKINDQS